MRLLDPLNSPPPYSLLPQPLEDLNSIFTWSITSANEIYLIAIVCDLNVIVT